MIGTRFGLAIVFVATAACAQPGQSAASTGATQTDAEIMAEMAPQRTQFRAAVRDYMQLFGGCPRVQVSEDQPKFDALYGRYRDLAQQYRASLLAFDFEVAIEDANYLNSQLMATIRCATGEREPTERDRVISRELIDRANRGLDRIEAAGAAALKGAD